VANPYVRSGDCDTTLETEVSKKKTDSTLNISVQSQKSQGFTRFEHLNPVQ